ncbi:MAG TPA: lantibiotic dehydratase [Pyrinomonadaceae bacterium]
MEAIEKSHGHTVEAAAATALADPGPSHLMPLPGSEWSLWRWSCLRATGFPVDTVLKLTADGCIDDLRKLLEAEAESEQRRNEALAATRAAFEPLRFADEKTERRRLSKAIGSLNKSKPPAAESFAGEIRSLLESYRVAHERQVQLDASFREKYKESLSEIAKAISTIASESRFQEAVIWQNRRAFNTAVLEFLRKADTRLDNSRHRQHLELIASYLQRYSLKNDTIGFFGPVGWATFDPGSEFSARPGKDLIATRTVYFEAWCIDELVEGLNKFPQLRPWMAPRPVPYLHLEGNTLHLPKARPIQLTGPQALALRLADGKKAAREIAAALKIRFPYEIKNEAESYKVLEFLQSRALISWKFEVAPGMYPERALRKLLESIDDVALRERALKPLDELELGRQAVARASGNPEKLQQALDELDANFERLTATASTRAAGQMYAARTLVYEDCRRDVDVQVGQELLQRMGPPLSLLLTSARWFTFQVAEYYRDIYQKIYTELVNETKSAQVSGALFWYRTHDYLMESSLIGSNHVLPEFQRRWAELLPTSADQKQVSFTVEDLKPKVEKLFAAPRPGWSSGRHHSPDVMVAAKSAEAIRQGDYELVLGEFHLGTNTLRGSLFVLQHPNPDEIFQAVERDMPELGLRINPPKSWPGLTARTTPVLLPSENWWLLVTHDSLVHPEKHNLPIGSMVVERVGENLIAKTRDGRLRFDIIEAFADVFSSSTTSKFKLFASAPHTPRVTIDDMVVSRESWMFAVSEMPFANEETDSQRFLEAARWAKQHGLPQYVFVKSPVEVKPFYVDFNSPVYVDIFAKVVRRTGAAKGDETLIAVSEMLPAHEHAWLTDAEGRHYASEFRIVAVDPAR